jgi:hypothetical protein
MASVLPISNETALSVVLLGLGVYFLVLLVRGLRGYLLFRKVRPTALLTWPVPRTGQLPFLLALGIVATAVTALNAYLQRPLHHVLSQALMAAYFVLMVPLCQRIRLGFYSDGVWADSGFLPYGKIGRIAFRESPEIVLILLPRGRSRSFRLPVPPEEYGAVRKMLEEKIRARVVNMEAGILGL